MNEALIQERRDRVLSMAFVDLGRLIIIGTLIVLCRHTLLWMDIAVLPELGMVVFASLINHLDTVIDPTPSTGEYEPDWYYYD